MQKYRLLGKKGEGTFSEVLKAQCIRNSKYVAIKCMKHHFESVDQVNRMREIQALRRLSPHPNIIKLYEVLYDRSTGRLALVFELMDVNVYELIRDRSSFLPEQQILTYMYQLVKAIEHMHKNGIFHRDVKPENVLVLGETLKLADFGSCRGIYSKKPFTEYISTRWYRAPECLLTDGYYNFEMDIWGVGCVFYEIVMLLPLFPGQNESDQINRIHEIMGTPSMELLNQLRSQSQHTQIDFDTLAKHPGTGLSMAHANDVALDLLKSMLAYDPQARVTAKDALRHPYFDEPRRIEGQSRRDKRALKGRARPPAPAGMPPAEEEENRSVSLPVLSKQPLTGGAVQPSQHSVPPQEKLPSLSGR